MVDTTIKLGLENFTGGKIKSAFPAYRIFIFGQEVTQDVIETRVNHSGGSAERAAGTCSFTLVNPDNKYTLTYADMLTIGRSAAAYREVQKKRWVDNGFGGTTPRELLEMQRSADMWEKMNELPEEAMARWLKYETLQGREADFSQLLLNRVKKMEEGMVEHQEEIDAKYEAIARNLNDYSYANPYSALNLISFSAQEFGAYTTKVEVLLEKLNFYTQVTYDKAFSHLESQTLMQYPFQQGDCIFHPNDPVRVAFRDPFDPRVWYWMFTGFMDAWTENSGVNMDSTITINCTDVTKMARYSFIQIGVGLQDPNIIDLVTQLDSTTQATKKVQYLGQLFAGLTMLESLDTLFFGTDVAQATTEDVITAQVALMSDKALSQYLADEELMYVNPGLDRAVQEAYAVAAKTEKRDKLIEQAGEWPALSVPAPFMTGVEKGDATTEDYQAKAGTIIAKKKGNRHGTHAYFYGELTEYDKTLGEGIISLNWLNEVLHHRVRERDLVDMALKEETYRQKLMSGGSSTPATIISLIGKGKTEFPVGHGRVFYISQAQLADGQFGREIIDRSFGGHSGLFSIYKDKLSFIYDMAERVDFRFYATPKGDFVYEMPFYDFDPIYFTDDSMEGWELKASQVQKYLDDEMLPHGSTSPFFSTRDLEAMGFYSNFENTEDITTWSNAEPFDYRQHFTIEREEQLSFSNTATDQGIATVFRCYPKTVASYSGIDGGTQLKKNQYVVDQGASFTLGVRVADADVWGFITSEEEAKFYAALMLSRLNAEAKNVSISTLPKFGLMVNRPMFWRERNYYANVVSLQHSIVWASSADTTVNLNQLRGWSGETNTATGYPIHKHFSGSDRPFSMGELTTSNSNTQGSS